MLLMQRAVGTFSNYATAEIALRELKGRGFVMEKVSLVGRDINNHTEGTGANTSSHLTAVGNLNTPDNAARETAQQGAVAGSTLGGLTGLLVGLGAVAIPGVGPVMLAGAAATAIATAVSGSLIGGAAGSLVGGLAGLEIPADRAKIYSDRVARGEYLVMVEGTKADIALAALVFSNHDIHEWYTYDLPNSLAQTVA